MADHTPCAYSQKLPVRQPKDGAGSVSTFIDGIPLAQPMTARPDKE
jgi:hypothetical protein